jgi:hypothetical protein
MITNGTTVEPKYAPIARAYDCSCTRAITAASKKMSTA